MSDEDVRAALAAGELDLPLPGSGATLQRWEGLAALGRRSCVLGRLGEGHVDAVAILAELAGPPADGLWGVWAAEPPSAKLLAHETPAGWVLDGRKAWCSGATVVDRALVTAHAPDGRRLFAVEAADLAPDLGSWPAVGMAGSGSFVVSFDGVPATPVGGVRGYLDRPGFWHGGVGVAACWWGCAVGVADTLLEAAPSEPHALAHLGAVVTLLAGMHDTLAVSAAEIDADPLDREGGARARASRVRAAADLVATDVLTRTGRALGAAPLGLSAHHAQQVADLTVYLRQSHAERDLADLGAQVVERPDLLPW